MIQKGDKTMITQAITKNKMIQRNQIVAYLEQHGSATVRDLVVDLNINSPTKRISELVQMGCPIEKEWVHVINRRGEKKRYMRYRLRKEAVV